ncbi:PCR3-like protein [Mya arenaria]|uniref:PCR3-like protein n=1 Tax=Mya arenaria TaxID=6604 RepID=A0ABY7DP86_MYAAR|nr:PCR3-like protein [Mya arenaria]
MVSTELYEQSSEWAHGLCSCFDDLGVCIIAYLAPCVLFGQSAEKMGEGRCVVCGLVYFIPILNLIEAVIVRGKIREQSGIDGTTCHDCLTIAFCPLCALVQEAMEIEKTPAIMSMARE